MDQNQTLAMIGLTQEELQSRVIETIANRMMEKVYTCPGEYGEEVDSRPSQLAQKLEKRVREMVDKGIEDVAAKHVLPNVTQYLETLCLQETNKWGEKKGKTLTFIEYLVQRAENYMREEVNYNGLSREEANDYSWKGSNTRISNLVHQHLQYSIKAAMERALKNANAVFIDGLNMAVKIKLDEVLAELERGRKK